MNGKIKERGRLKFSHEKSVKGSFTSVKVSMEVLKLVNMIVHQFTVKVNSDFNSANKTKIMQFSMNSCLWHIQEKQNDFLIN